MSKMLGRSINNFCTISSCFRPHSHSNKPVHLIFFRSSSNWACSYPPSGLLGVTFLSDTCAAFYWGATSLTGRTDTESYTRNGRLGNLWSLEKLCSNSPLFCSSHTRKTISTSVESERNVPPFILRNRFARGPLCCFGSVTLCLARSRVPAKYP